MSWTVNIKADTGLLVQTTISSDDSSLCNLLKLILETCTAPPLTTLSINIIKGK